jgi:M6 family metalloprotease-like protein
MRLKRLFFVFNILAVMSLLVQGGGYPIAQAGSPVYLGGTFIIIWGDGTPGSGETRISYFLSTKQNENIQLSIEEELLTSVAGPISLNQKAVVVQGTWLDAGTILQVQSITLANGEQAGPEGIYGPRPWVSILCKFSDYSVAPRNLAYFQGMYSSNYPGLDHFWRQQSYDLVNLEGSGAYGWYTLPYPRSHYVPPSGNLNWGAAAQDCTNVANSLVDFSPYIGVNLMFNADLDGYAWGGTWWLCLDGPCRVWSVTWEPPWGYESVSVIAHETGHGFGLPHSSGNYGQTYDNQWDVMSNNWAPCNRGGVDATYGCLGQHTISYHKDMLGWITPAQRYTANPGTVRTITLERLALPQTENYLTAFVPILGSPGLFYTVEARQLIGYDVYNPGSAVIIHHVDPSRDNDAHVIDIDGNGNTGDAGAMWIPGEVFKDEVNGISISIDSATETGYVVTINNRFTTMESVALSGSVQGQLGDGIPFTATVSPDDATTPITYTWEATGLSPVVHIGEIVDGIEFTWEEIGTKVITVTASNAGGTVVNTQLIEIDSAVPVVSLSGPAESGIGSVNVFTATVLPSDVTQPITYTWIASGQTSISHTTGLSDTVSYVWDDPGTKVITVTAMNIFGSTTDTLSLPVRMAPAFVEVSGPDTGNVRDSYTFTASVNPTTTTVPITYIWYIDDQLTFTHTAGISDTATFNWDSPGLHQVTVSATNPAGSVVDVWSITIYVKTFLPINLRN